MRQCNTCGDAFDEADAQEHPCFKSWRDGFRAAESAESFIRDAYALGRQEESSEAVAYLRAQATIWKTGQEALLDCAAAIERGAHQGVKS
jgi:hypothetical protein